MRVGSCLTAEVDPEDALVVLPERRFRRSGPSRTAPSTVALVDLTGGNDRQIVSRGPTVRVVAAGRADPGRGNVGVRHYYWSWRQDLATTSACRARTRPGVSRSAAKHPCTDAGPSLA